jgi:hypothetical protein
VFDPRHSLSVKNMLGATYLVADFVLPDAKILETLWVGRNHLFRRSSSG